MNLASDEEAQFYLSGAVGVRAVGDIQYDDCTGVLVDPVPHAPVSTSPSGMLPGVLVPQ
jgi:hypothetical protein